MEFLLPIPTEEDFLNPRKRVLILSLSKDEGAVTEVEIIDNGKAIRLTLDMRAQIIGPNQT
jgi:hypothetical protein